MILLLEILLISITCHLVEGKDFNALIGNNTFSDRSVKNKQEAYERPVEMSKNSDYTTRNLLDYLYRQKYFKLIGLFIKIKNAAIP